MQSPPASKGCGGAESLFQGERGGLPPFRFLAGFSAATTTAVAARGAQQQAGQDGKEREKTSETCEMHAKISFLSQR